jgi:hypothetical protein
MRASKLITISTVAVLMGSTGLAIGGGSLQSGASTQGPAAIEQGSPGSSETKASRPRAGERLTRRSEVSGERGSKIEGSRALGRGRAMTSERSRALLKGARGQALAAERQPAAAGQGLRAAAQIQGQPGSRARQSFAPTGGPVYARATPSEARVGLTSEQRAHLREIVTARRDIPRVSNLPSVRINAVVPRNVHLAPVPDEIARYYPRFRRDQAFIYRNQIVLVDPATSRIVAVLPT